MTPCFACQEFAVEVKRCCLRPVCFSCLHDGCVCLSDEPPKIDHRSYFEVTKPLVLKEIERLSSLREDYVKKLQDCKIETEDDLRVFSALQMSVKEEEIKLEYIKELEVQTANIDLQLQILRSDLETHISLLPVIEEVLKTVEKRLFLVNSKECKNLTLDPSIKNPFNLEYVNNLLKKNNIESKYIEELRITDDKVIIRKAVFTPGNYIPEGRELFLYQRLQDDELKLKWSIRAPEEFINFFLLEIHGVIALLKLCNEKYIIDYIDLQTGELRVHQKNPLAFQGSLEYSKLDDVFYQYDKNDDKIVIYDLNFNVVGSD